MALRANPLVTAARSAMACFCRGRDAPHGAPPAQNRTCGFPEYGSHLGSMTAKRRLVARRTRFRSCDTLPRLGVPSVPRSTVFPSAPLLRSPLIRFAAQPSGGCPPSFAGVPACQTTRDRQGAGDNAPCRTAFRLTDSVGIPHHRAFAAQYLAHRRPCQRFNPGLAPSSA